MLKKFIAFFFQNKKLVSLSFYKISDSKLFFIFFLKTTTLLFVLFMYLIFLFTSKGKLLQCFR